MPEWEFMKNLFVIKACLRVFLLSAVVVITANSVSYGCSAPVFRYALENWPADPYFVGIVHKGELTGEAKAAAELLEKYCRSKGGAANIAINYLDILGPHAAELKDVIAFEKIDPNEPCLLVYLPAIAGSNKPVWKSPLTAEHVEKIIDSPMRREIAKHLLEADSAVWVFLETGDAEKDDPAAKLLEERLSELEDKIELPEGPWLGEEDSQYKPQVQLSFSMIRLARDDSDEAFLVNALLGSEPDLLEFDEPMAFPVMGRGLVLYALVGKGITGGNILQACEFLAGACSCVVKARNPGVDLLMNVDWENLIEPIIVEEPLPQLVNISEFLRPEDRSTPVIAEHEETIAVSGETESAGGSLVRNVIITLAGCFVLAVCVTAVLRRGGRSG